MQIRYRNTLQHLVALQKYVLRNTATGRKMMLHRFLAVETIVVFITILFMINHNRLNVLMGFIVVSGLAWMFRERSVLLQFRKDFKRERRKDETGQFDRDRLLSISPQGLTIAIGAQETRHGWDEVDMTGRDRKYVYIILKGVLHYIIPISAFADQNEAELFTETLESYRTSRP